jgi:WD40 repeat protein
MWSYDGRFLVLWESLIEYKVFIYYPDGRIASSYSPYADFLGIKCISWSPSSQLLAIGGFDEKVL